MLDRTLYGSHTFPFEYGFIKNTKGSDGDSLDAVLLVSNATFSGCVVESEIIGYLEMEDESGIDHKVLAVPTDKIDPRASHIEDVKDLTAHQKAEIKDFFETYKRLEPNKWVKVKEFRSREEAEKLVQESMK